MEEEESSSSDNVFFWEEACRSTNDSFVGAFVCQKTRCVLSISTKIHTHPHFPLPRRFVSFILGQNLNRSFAAPAVFKVIQGLQLRKTKSNPSPFRSKVPCSCVLGVPPLQHWRDIMRRPLGRGIFVRKPHIGRSVYKKKNDHNTSIKTRSLISGVICRNYVPLCAKGNNQGLEKSLRGVLLAEAKKDFNARAHIW